MTIGITGGSGMIGTRLLEKLFNFRKNISIKCITRNLKRSIFNESIHWIQGDLNSIKDCHEFIEGLDIIVHLAQSNTPAQSDLDWASDFTINAGLGINLLQAIREIKEKKIHFIFASSGGAVYGPWRGRPFRETDDCMPLSPYGIQKLCFENYLRLASEEGVLSAICLRFANVYGSAISKQKKQGLIAIAIQNALNNEPFTLYGPEFVIRDYIYIDDICDSIIASFNIKKSFVIYNIGTNVGTSTICVLDIIQKKLNYKFNIISSDYGKDIFRFNTINILDNSVAINELNWKPKILLDEGVQKMINYYLNKY